MTSKRLAMLAMALTSGIASQWVDYLYQFRNFHEPLPEPFARKGRTSYRHKLIYGMRGGGISADRLKREPRRYCSITTGGQYGLETTGNAYPRDYRWACVGGARTAIRNKRKLLGSR